MMDRLPTHEEVAKVLDKSHPAIAEMVRGCDSKRNCWGDIIVQCQHDFDPHDVATCFRVLYMKGWSRYIVLTWCPLSIELWNCFQRAKKLQDDYKELSERDKQFRKFTIHGALALTQVIYKKHRQKWMQEWSLRHEDDSEFFNKIILYLESKREMENEKVCDQSN